ncbi:MAG: hypothetical protein U0263_02485 [Polyangiaceae bacterium]
MSNLNTTLRRLAVLFGAFVVWLGMSLVGLGYLARGSYARDRLACESPVPFDSLLEAGIVLPPSVKICSYQGGPAPSGSYRLLLSKPNAACLTSHGLVGCESLYGALLQVGKLPGWDRGDSKVEEDRARVDYVRDGDSISLSVLRSRHGEMTADMTVIMNPRRRRTASQ